MKTQSRPRPFQKRGSGPGGRGPGGRGGPGGRRPGGRGPGSRGPGGRRFFRKKVCRFCADRVTAIDYKQGERLTKFLTEKGKIVPRRTTGNCAGHQRMITSSIKRARHAAVLAFQTAG